MQDHLQLAVEPLKPSRRFQSVIRKSLIDVDSTESARSGLGSRSGSYGVSHSGDIDGCEEDEDEDEGDSDVESSDTDLAYLENEGNRYIRKCELILQKSRDIDTKIKSYKQRMDWLERRKKQQHREAGRTSTAGTRDKNGACSRLENKIEHAKKTISSLAKENNSTCREVDKLRLARIAGVNNGASSQSDILRISAQLEKMQAELEKMTTEIRDRQDEMHHAEHAEMQSDELLELELQRIETEAQEIETGGRGRQRSAGDDAKEENPLNDYVASLTLMQQSSSAFGNMSIEDEQRLKRKTISVRWVRLLKMKKGILSPRPYPCNVSISCKHALFHTRKLPPTYAAAYSQGEK